jgi:hypothetical protein
VTAIRALAGAYATACVAATMICLGTACRYILDWMIDAVRCYRQRRHDGETRRIALHLTWQNRATFG